MSAVLWGLKRFLLIVPDSVHEELLSRLVNHLMKGQPQAERLATLEGCVAWSCD